VGANPCDTPWRKQHATKAVVGEFARWYGWARRGRGPSKTVPAARLIERDRARAAGPAAICVCRDGDPSGRSPKSLNLPIGKAKPHDFPMGQRKATKNCPGLTVHLQLSRDSRNRHAHSNAPFRNTAAPPGAASVRTLARFPNPLSAPRRPAPAPKPSTNLSAYPHDRP
jgi:hypothetical protein